MDIILFALWFFLPAGVANVSPVFSRRIKPLKFLLKPMDLGLKFRDKRIFGENKTWVGLLFGVFIGLVVIALQIYGFHHSEWIRSISENVNYSESNIWLLGPLLGFGALFGDAVESFFKRQFNVKPGNAWIPFDQIDYIIGGILFSLLIVTLSIHLYVAIFVAWVLVHLLFSYIGYLVGVKKKPI